MAGSQEAHIAYLEHATPDVWLVSCSDKLHNARAIGTDLRMHDLAETVQEMKRLG